MVGELGDNETMYFHDGCKNIFNVSYIIMCQHLFVSNNGWSWVIFYWHNGHFEKQTEGISFKLLEMTNAHNGLGPTHI